jgi:hypothetical protein
MTGYIPIRSPHACFAELSELKMLAESDFLIDRYVSHDYSFCICRSSENCHLSETGTWYLFHDFLTPQCVPLCISLLFIYVNRSTIGEYDAVGAVECFQINSPVADAELYGYYSSQDFAVPARIEAGQRQLVPTLLRLVVDCCQMTYFPDKIVVGFCREPRFQYVADTIALILRSEELSRALQLSPEHYETILGIFDFDHYDYDHYDH